MLLKPHVIDPAKHELVKYRLRLAGFSFSDVARELGITPKSVSAVSRGFGRSKRVEAKIAEILCECPEEIWPERYEEAS